jgi:hypothetical protein
LIWWLTAEAVMNNSSAAAAKLSLRAADSKTRSAFSGGKRLIALSSDEFFSAFC